MTKNKPARQSRKSAWTYLKPSGGFTKGTLQGIKLCAGLLLLLFLTVFVLGAPPGTAQAVVADVLLGLLLAVAGVWVVGGMIEFDSTVKDVSIKAGGGIAILLLSVFYFSPFYSAAKVQVSHIENYKLNSWATVAIILDEFQMQFRQDERDAINIHIPSNIAQKVLRFRPDPVGNEIVYKDQWSFLCRNPNMRCLCENPKLRILKKIESRQKCLSFEDINGTVHVKLNEELLESRIRPEDGATIYLCKS